MIAPIEVPAISAGFSAELVEHLADEDVHHPARAAAAKSKTNTRTRPTFLFLGGNVDEAAIPGKPSLDQNIEIGG